MCIYVDLMLTSGCLRCINVLIDKDDDQGELRRFEKVSGQEEWRLERQNGP